MTRLIERLRKTRTAECETDAADEGLYVASQWRLMWLKFRRHRLAVGGGYLVIGLYLIALLNGFVSPNDPQARSPYPNTPPHGIRFFDGGRLRPHVYGLIASFSADGLTRTIIEDPETKYAVRFFVKGWPYKILGLIPWDVHLLGAAQGGYIFLMGSDKLGRDAFSRTLNGATISLTVGLAGVLVSFLLGSIIGGFSGYYGGAFDTFVQRLIEFIISMPTIPLWMALSAAVPKDWTPVRVYFAITMILTLHTWCGMARIVRGKLLEVREEDYVLEAKLGGASDWRIVVVHMLPAFTSYLIVDLTLAIPRMILGETALSFLGLGLRPPVISWGVLLQDAQNVRTVSLHPWLLLPGAFVVVTVLAFNFLGDGLRDAADPYKM